MPSNDTARNPAPLTITTVAQSADGFQVLLLSAYGHRELRCFILNGCETPVAREESAELLGVSAADREAHALKVVAAHGS